MSGSLRGEGGFRRLRYIPVRLLKPYILTDAQLAAFDLEKIAHLKGPFRAAKRLPYGINAFSFNRFRRLIIPSA
jgi:hypothetical protein